MTTEPARATAGPLPPRHAVDRVLAAVRRGPPEEVPLAEAAGRVLAAPVVAAEDLWPFARAAMDGIAVRAADVADASPHRPVRLRLTGVAYAGQPAARPLGVGEAARVATGAPVPPGADAVIPQEVVQWAGDTVLVARPAPPGQHIFPPGEDVRAGEQVLTPGTVLHGGHIGLLASMGWARVPVVRRPVVAIVTCGDELVAPEAPLRPGLVRDSNSYTIAAEVQALGALPLVVGRARDDEAELDALVRRGLEAGDLLITCGGLSVGERDLIRPALRRAGVVFAFEGVAMKPGAPAAFGVLAAAVDDVAPARRAPHPTPGVAAASAAPHPAAGTLSTSAEGPAVPRPPGARPPAAPRPVFALPGTPSACRVAFEVLVVPALGVMLGRTDPLRPRAVARLAASVRVRPGRARYLWGTATLRADGMTVAPLYVQSTAALRSSADANALIVLEPATGDLPAGTPVPVLLLGGLPVLPPARAAQGPAAVGIVGARGAGKTTLVERLIPLLAARGVRVTVVKHHAHLLALDEAGTDTARAAAAGAARTILVGPAGLVIREPHTSPEPSRAAPSPAGPSPELPPAASSPGRPSAGETPLGEDAVPRSGPVPGERRAVRAPAAGPTLDDVLRRIPPGELVLVEGFSEAALPKILVRRTGASTDRPDPPGPFLAGVGDAPAETAVPWFSWDDLERLAAYLVSHLVAR
ncbi:MAG: molybdopterin-guanine dinucleotide biosynthesis protein MobB [Firmicutes bacterium]|nr:molybdopterin-guanine dinucleotide biosynthesis protein MobB [Bacillota bacterium]